MVNWIEGKHKMHSSSYKWCTIFLFSMLYKIPFFCVVLNSCFLWCTIFLKNGMMYLIPVWHVVPSSVVGKSFFSNFECCTIFWCIQVCVPNCPASLALQSGQLERGRIFQVTYILVAEQPFHCTVHRGQHGESGFGQFFSVCFRNKLAGCAENLRNRSLL